MKIQNNKRKRGVELTPKGLEKLLEAKRQSEAVENCGNRYTLAEISTRSGLYTGTISKVLNQEGGVDKRTIEELFKAFNLTLDKSDYLNSNTRVDWGEATCATVFYGRQEELTTLEQWILHERCRLVAILGIGGIGKTALSVKFAQKVQNNFEYVVWRSLRDAPPVDTLVSNLIKLLSDENQKEAELPEKLSDKISRLIDYLRTHRCLLIFDNVESILRHKTRAGLYREGYEGYGELFKRLGETNHQSCLVLTSREKPQEIASLEGEALPVRSLRLSGLNVETGHEIFKVKGLCAYDNEWKAMMKRYGGHPLALKIVATTIQDVFDGNVTKFLNQETTVFGEISDILEQQFERLSDLEKEIIYWLAIHREPMPITMSELQKDIASPIAPSKLLETLESLGRRSLVEKSQTLFTLQPVFLEYVTHRFVDQLCEEILNNRLVFFRSHALMKGQGKDYLKEAQIRFILQPLLNKLLLTIGCKRSVEEHLTQILTNLKETSPQQSGYTAKNIINLLSQLGTNLRHHDLSYQGYYGTVLSIAFSPDGSKLASSGKDKTIRLWDIHTSEVIQTFKGHSATVRSITFNPNNQTLASCSDDGTIRLWDVTTGECLKIMKAQKPYDNMNTVGVTVFNKATITTLKKLGAVEEIDTCVNKKQKLLAQRYRQKSSADTPILLQ